MPTEKQSKLLIAAPAEDRAALRKILEDRWPLLEAEDEDSAADVIRKRYHELGAVLLSGNPDLFDGYRLTGILRGLDVHPLPLLLIISNNQQDDLYDRAVELGADDFLIRPFNPLIVRKRVESCIQLSRSRRLLSEQEADYYDRFIQKHNPHQKSAEAIIDTLSTLLEFRGYQPGSHVRRVRQIVSMLLTELSGRYSLSPERINQLSTAAAMHDIGKITVPAEILLQPGALTETQMEIIHEHTVNGSLILKQMNPEGKSQILSDAADIALSHHERWNGSGYPRKLKGNEISIAAQATGLADVYDTLINNRIYKGAYSHEEAAQIIREGTGILFSEEMIHAFNSIEHGLKLWPRFIPAIPARVGEQLAVEQQLRRIALARNEYILLSNLSGEMFFHYSCREETLRFSDAFCRTFGRTETEKRVARSEMETYLTTRVFTDLAGNIFRLTPENPQLKLEMQLKKADGELHWYEGYFCAQYEKKKLTSYYGKLIDIDYFRKEALHWEEEAMTDPLTGLLNRAGMEKKVRTLLQEKRPLAFFFLDLDNFKGINDTYGHLFGDRVLCHVAAQIRQRMRSEDLVGRIGGDEFLAVLSHPRPEEIINERAAQLCGLFSGLLSAALAAAGTPDREQIPLSGSVGISVSPKDGTDYAELLRRADLALYHAKNAGKNTWHFYSDALPALNKRIITEID